jgi:hypothetical protein
MKGAALTMLVASSVSLCFGQEAAPIRAASRVRGAEPADGVACTQ